MVSFRRHFVILVRIFFFFFFRIVFALDFIDRVAVQFDIDLSIYRKTIDKETARLDLYGSVTVNDSSDDVRK